MAATSEPETRTVFLTGATGTIGGAVLRALARQGFRVTCLIRNKDKRSQLESMGAAATVVGPLTATRNEVLIKIAAGFDAIVHTALPVTDDAEAIERSTIAAFFEATRGKKCHIVVTSTLWTIGETSGDDLVTEETSTTEGCVPFAAWRVKVEEEDVLAHSDSTAVVRPSWVYGGTTGYVTQAFDVWREKQVIVLPDVEKEFNMIHEDDLGELYAAIVANQATGVFHGCDGIPVSVSQVEEWARKWLGVSEVQRKPVMEAFADIGAWALGMNVNQRVAPARATSIGWKPAHTSFYEWAESNLAAE
jgi:nucleoside-diphosphate-sugar epimerase